MTEDLCNGTRTTVKTGSVLAYDGPVRIMNIDAGAAVHHFCDFDGIESVSRVFCTLLTFAPELGLYGTGIVTLGDATSYDLCVTDPTGAERCETYALSEPINAQGHRESVVGCYTDGGPGAYSLRFRIDGVKSSRVFGFSSDRLAGQDCIQRPVGFSDSARLERPDLELRLATAHLDLADAFEARRVGQEVAGGALARSRLYGLPLVIPSSRAAVFVVSPTAVYSTPALGSSLARHDLRRCSGPPPS